MDGSRLASAWPCQRSLWPQSEVIYSSSMDAGLAIYNFLTHGPARRRDVLTLIGMSFAAKRLRAAGEKFESLADWMRASRATRKEALASCLERIQHLDPSI